MKSALVFFFILSVSSICAQPLFSFWELRDSSQHSFTADSKFESNANTLPNSMLAGLLWGGYLEKDYLHEVTNRLKKSGNRFGFQFDNQLVYQWKGKKYLWAAGIKYREVLGLKFSNDLFGIAFLGNGSYEGVNADVSQTKLAYWNYTGISFGTTRNITDRITLYTGISALYGLNHQSLSTQEAHIYTAVDGEYIRTQGKLTVGYKEPGYGAGLAVNGNFQWRSAKNLICFDLRDLGFMQFQTFSSFNGQSDNTYKGINISNLNNFTGDSLFSDFSTRGFARRFNIIEVKKRFTVLTPFIFTAYYSRRFTKKWKMVFDVYYTCIPAYNPRFTGRAIRTFNHYWQVSGGLAYGGFGKQNLQIGAKKDLKRNWSFELESYFLGLAILPENSNGGFGLQGRLYKGF